MSKRSLEEALGLVPASGAQPQPEEPKQDAEPDPRLSMWQRSAAERAGLPPLVAGRLVGTTEAELQADARRLAESLDVQEPPPSVEALILARKQQAQVEATKRLIQPQRSQDQTPVPQTTDPDHKALERSRRLTPAPEDGQ